jgi:threonine/homoserine/homoserine lactone efflux protein
MDTAALTGLLLVLGVALATPGPNALTAFAHAGMYGVRSNVSLITGMAIGIFAIEFSVGMLIDALQDNALALTALHWVGMLFLGAMVVGMGRVQPSTIVSQHTEAVLGLKAGIAMQFMNGKEWAFVVIIMTQFVEPMGGGMTGVLTIIAITLGVCIPAMVAWTFIGQRLNDVFLHPTRGPAVMRTCAALLGLLWVAFLLQGPPSPA